MIRIILPLVCAVLGFAAASCSQSGNPFATADAPASAQPPLHGAASAAMASPPDSPQARRAASAPATDQSSSGAPQPAATPAGATPPAAAPSDQMPSDPVPQDQVPSLDEAPPASTPQASASQSTAAQTTPDAPTGTPAERRASTLIGMPVVSTDGSPLGDVKDIVFDQQGRATHLVIAYGMAPDASPADTADAARPAPSLDGKLTAMPWDAAAASIKEGRVVLDGAKLQDAPSFTSLAWPNLDDPGWSGTADAYWRKAVRAAIAAHPGAPIDSTTRQRGRRSRDND